jgi:hypothetical protein
VTGDVWRVTSDETADGGDAAATKEADARAARSYLGQRSNGFVFDPKSCDALATALALVTDMGDRRWANGRGRLWRSSAARISRSRRALLRVLRSRRRAWGKEHGADEK